MPYNLIDERWIPVARRSGRVELIAPAQVVEREDPPLRIASSRPDFDGALLELLVGLLQTAAAPISEQDWEREYDDPPTVAALARRLSQVRKAFFLDGEGPRFMQDLTVAKDAKASSEPIGALLIDRIGESGLIEGPSLFAKPARFDALGYPAAAAALMALQTYAPAGGRGQLTSLRGGGPLTTLIAADRLWATVWLNVLPRPDFERRVPGDVERDGPGDIFPWMAKTRTSESKGGASTPPQDVHPLQHLWGLPRRVRLVIQADAAGTCAVSGASGVPVVQAYLNRPDGTSYDGAYRHPWTPYSLTKPGEPWNPKKAGADGLPYRDWPLLATGSPERAPSAVVSYFMSTRRRDRVAQPRLLAFGYALNKMKPLRWCCAETPLISVAPKLAGAFAKGAEGLVGASEEVRQTLAGQVRAAWSDRPGDLDVSARLNPAFWARTEPGFFGTVAALKAALEAADSAALARAREAWLAELHEAALALFDELVAAPIDLAAPDLRRAVKARRDLIRFTHPSSTKPRKLLGLPVDEPTAPDEPPRARRTRKEATT